MVCSSFRRIQKTDFWSKVCQISRPKGTRNPKLDMNLGRGFRKCVIGIDKITTLIFGLRERRSVLFLQSCADCSKILVYKFNREHVSGYFDGDSNKSVTLNLQCFNSHHQQFLFQCTFWKCHINIKWNFIFFRIPHKAFYCGK